MKTVKVNIAHEGAKSVVVPVPGGTRTVNPNDALTGIEVVALNEDQLALYKAKGVTITAARRASSKGPDLSALEKAVEAAREKRAKALAAVEAEGSGDAEDAALNDAEDELEAAEAALAEAKK